jgi:hypothetical protein
MKQYDSIEYYGDHWGLPGIGFDKLDGSNLRFEYSQKRGFYKSGSRNMMIDEKHDQFGFAVSLFNNKYGDALGKVFKTKNYRNSQSFVCFAELIGKNSSFGQHDFANDVFDIVLFDVSEHKRGLIPPKQFVDDFGHTGIPRVVYTGNLNKELIKQVKNNQLEGFEGSLTEGIIFKGQIKTKKGNNQLYYCKIKTNDWFTRLRSNHYDLYSQEIKQAGLKGIPGLNDFGLG